MNRSSTASDSSFLFQVEITVSALNKGAAMEQLIKVLNNSELVDYQIGSGTAIKESPKKPTANASPQPETLDHRIQQYIQSNKLIRLNINKGRGVKMDIPCRIINFDAGNQLLTVYHVDEKQVYSINLNEIDDFLE